MYFFNHLYNCCIRHLHAVHKFCTISRVTCPSNYLDKHPLIKHHIIRPNESQWPIRKNDCLLSTILMNNITIIEFLFLTINIKSRNEEWRPLLPSTKEKWKHGRKITSEERVDQLMMFGYEGHSRHLFLLFWMSWIKTIY